MLLLSHVSIILGLGLVFRVAYMVAPIRPAPVAYVMTTFSLDIFELRNWIASAEKLCCEVIWTMGYFNGRKNILCVISEMLW